MDRLVAPGGPASAADNVAGVILAAVDDRGRVGLRLEVALVAKALAARFEHLVVDRAVRGVARHATFAHHLVLEDVGTGLSRVALSADGRGVAREGSCASVIRVGFTFVRVVAARAGYLAGQNGVRVWQRELGARVDVALQARLGRILRIDDGRARTGLNVNRSRTVTGFTGRLLVSAVLAFHDEFRVRRVMETAGDVRVTLAAGLFADVSRASHAARHRHDTPRLGDRARDQKDGPYRKSGNEQGLFRAGLLFGEDRHGGWIQKLFRELADENDQGFNISVIHSVGKRFHLLLALGRNTALLDQLEDVRVGDLSHFRLEGKILGSGLTTDTRLALAVGTVATGTVLIPVFRRFGSDGALNKKCSGNEQGGKDTRFHRVCGTVYVDGFSDLASRKGSS